MKKIYSFVLLAITLLLSTNIWATDVSSADELKNALANGGNITLTQDITTSASLNVTKSVTLNGQGKFTIKGTDRDVFSIAATEPISVKFNNLTIFAANSSGRGIGIQTANNLTLSLENVTINTRQRGMTVYTQSEFSQIAIHSSIIQLVKDENGTPYDYDKEYNNSDTRGLSLWDMQNTSVDIQNTTIQGFTYDINVSGSQKGSSTNNMKVSATNSTFKGRAALNVWTSNAEYVFTDCTVYGLNNQIGEKEGFGCFVFYGSVENGLANNNKLTINGGTTIAASFNGEGVQNPYATVFLIDNRGSGNEIVINNVSYTCPKDNSTKPDAKGGIVRGGFPSGSITINGGTYDCPELVTSMGTAASLVINGGNFAINVVSDGDEVSSNIISGTTINGGTFVVSDANQQIADIKDSEGNTLLGEDMKTLINSNGTTIVVPATTTEKTFSDAAATLVGTTATNIVKITQNAAVTLAANEQAEVYAFDMASGSKLVVESGATLTIGKGGVSFNNNENTTAPIIIVRPGARVVTNGLLYESQVENIILEASEKEQAQFIISPGVQSYGENHPHSTIVFQSKSVTNEDGSFVKQRFGIPTFTAPKSITATQGGNDIPTGFEYFDYTTHEWEIVGFINVAGKSMDKSKMNAPFHYYQMQHKTPTEGTIVTFTGELFGNANPTFEVLPSSWNGYANSLMMDMDIKSLLERIPNSVDKAVYLYSITEGNYNWEAKTFLDLDGVQLKPMQAFLIRNTKDAASVVVDYERDIFNPAMGIATSKSAPRQAMSDMKRVKLTVRGENGNGLDYVVLAESAEFSSGFDNGYDAVKYMNKDNINLYVKADENMSNYATDDLNNTYLSFESIKKGQYTITFTNVLGEAMTLIDTQTGEKTLMEENATYTFSAEANTVGDRRFMVTTAKMPASMEEVATPYVSGIYTLLGLYLGEMDVWNTLPSGIYVVNGKKVVK